MSDKSFESALRRLFPSGQLPKEARHPDGLERCLSDEEFACFIENKCSGGAEEEIFYSHLLNCKRCHEILSGHIVTVRAMEEMKEVVAPPHLIEAALKMGPSNFSKTKKDDMPPNIKKRMTSLVRPIYDSIEVTAYSSRMVEVSHFKEKLQGNHFRREICVENIVMNLEVSKRVAASIDLAIGLFDRRTRRLMDDVRADLLEQNRKIDFSDSRSGKVQFNKLEPGIYDVLFSRKQIRMGAFRIGYVHQKAQGGKP